MRALNYLQVPRVQVRIWLWLTITWIVMTPVTMVTVLRNSIPWLEFLSLFALVASCGTALVAALALVRADAAATTARHIVEFHPDIPPLASDQEEDKGANHDHDAQGAL